MPKYRRKKWQQAPYEREKKTHEEAGDENYLCSECNNSVEQVLQCESCWNWYCGPCQNTNEEMMQAAHFKCLHWFCLKCEPSVLKLVDKSKSTGAGDQSSACNGAFQEVIITAVVEQIKSIIQETKECFKKTIDETFKQTSKCNLRDTMETDSPSLSNFNSSSTTSDVISK